MRAARSVRSRLQGTGVLGQQAACELGMVGVVAKACGLVADVRRDLPGSLFSEEPMEIVTEVGGDCWARMSVRMREIDESVSWLTRVLHTRGAQLSVPPPARLGPLAPQFLCITMCEGFRGPVMQAVETGVDGSLLHYKIRDPSMPNWFGLALAMRGNEISDFPICNKSFDLSYCGNDL
jgi:Ni,Fe-hydrogenase III large subunit